MWRSQMGGGGRTRLDISAMIGKFIRTTDNLSVSSKFASLARRFCLALRCSLHNFGFLLLPFLNRLLLEFVFGHLEDQYSSMQENLKYIGFVLHLAVHNRSKLETILSSTHTGCWCCRDLNSICVLSMLLIASCQNNRSLLLFSELLDSTKYQMIFNRLYAIGCFSIVCSLN